ncbi:general odorant-binding protein 67 [Aedes albopictus]|uniref:OBP47-like domain-containing protein n=1 Tax=Aedes albopictus TaxID=7160 RepID=A0ABM1Z3W0_AEDAL|nr:general odorant-binding protein 67-like [Aedes albopictus]
MVTPWFIVLSFAVGFVTTYNSTWDKTCFKIKTNKRADDCCNIPGSFDEALLKQCYDEKKFKENEQEGVTCIAECVARELGAYKNNKLVKENVRLVFESTIGGDLNLKPVLEGVFDKCYDRISEIDALDRNKTGAACHFAPAFLLDCVHSGIFEKCPAGVWDGGDGCEELKEKLKRGCPYFAISETL